MTPERHTLLSPWRDRFPGAALALRGEGGTLHAAEDADGSLWLNADEAAIVDEGEPVSATRYAARERALWVAEVSRLRRNAHHGTVREEGPANQLLTRILDRSVERLLDLVERRQLTRINERDHLHPAVARAAVEYCGHAHARAQHRIDLPQWPRVGSVDIALARDGYAPILLELKCGSGTDALGQCVWDGPKLASILRAGGTAGYLVGGAPVDDWRRPVRGAEFFEDAEHDTALLRVLYGDWWRTFEKRSDPQPSELPRRWATCQVAEASLTIAGTEWLLRVAEVTNTNDEVLPWPRFLDA